MWQDDISSFIHYTLSNPQIRCVALDILWQPSSLPCLGIPSTMTTVVLLSLLTHA